MDPIFTDLSRFADFSRFSNCCRQEFQQVNKGSSSSSSAATATIPKDDSHYNNVVQQDDTLNSVGRFFIDSHVILMLSPITVTVIKLRHNFVTCGSDDSGWAHITAQNELQSTIQSLRAALDLREYQYRIPIQHYHNEYFIKFMVNFYSKSTNFFDKNSCFMIDLLNSVRAAKDIMAKDIIMEFPFNALNCLMAETIQKLVSQEYFGSRIQSFSTGSLMNLSLYAQRFEALQTPSNAYPQIQIDFNRKCLCFLFHVRHKQFLYRLEIAFSSIKYLILDLDQKVDSNQEKIYFETNASPFLYIQTVYPDKKTKQPKSRWSRVKDFQSSYATVLDDSLFNNSNGMDHFDPNIVGYSTGFRVDICSEKILNIIVYLCYICKDLNRNFSFYIGKIQKVNIKLFDMNAVSQTIDDYFASNYTINYACRVLFYRSYKMIDLLNYRNDLVKFMQKLSELAQDNETLLEECIYWLDTQNKNRIIDMYAELEKVYQIKKPIHEALQRKYFKPGEQIIMRPALLSPTKLEFCRPMTFLRSRFSNIANLDYALRLTLTEDNNRQLNGFGNDSEFIKKTIKPQLMEGIKVGERLFQFLGSSSSQMKESGIVFYAKDDKDRCAQTIRDMVGNLTNYKRKVAKYIARLGLIFSQAIAFYQFDPEIVTIYKSNDLTTKDKEFCFSDGIGIITKSLAQKILPLLRLPKEYFPSAFQIRHGGCKGMLVCYEEENQDFIIFRDSMIKYEAKDCALGILKFSAPRPVYLNRPFIQILDQKQVPPKVFHEIFTEAANLITKAILVESDAFNLIQTYHNKNIPYDKYYKAGLSFLHEPFFRRILNYLVYYKLGELKSRARIKLPTSQARMAFGVIDETKKLNSGEVFFQYTELDSFGAPTGKTFILDNQEVMITKFPCLSLGDVRKFRTVNIPELRHIKDCVVFPTKGDRPHTDEMGGSDLDGDEYAICWQCKLIFDGPNHKPMDFVSRTADDLSSDINLDDIVTFYCDYLLQNNIGKVANCHLMYSDFHPKGLLSKECAELATKYSISLDFQKNGVNSQLETKYQLNNKWIRPDFMEKKGYGNVYLSEKMLGQFYRHCSLVEDVIKMSDEFLIADEMNSDEKKMEPNFILDGWRKFEKEATEAFLEYNHRVVEIMESMNINSEVALLTNVYEEKTDATPFVFDRLFEYFRQKFECQCENITDSDRLLLISAWYAISFEKCDLLQYQYQNQPLLGLPFLVSDYMVQLVQYVQNKKCAVPLKESFVLTIDPSKLIGSFLRVEEPIQFTADLIMFWMKKLNVLFNHKFKSLKIFNDEQKIWQCVGEEKLLKSLVQNKLMLLYEDDLENRKLDQAYKVVFFLFNQFMKYLYGLCNMVNNFLMSGENLPQLLLLRYSLFALSFIDKLDDGIFLTKTEEFSKLQHSLRNSPNCSSVILQSYITMLFDHFTHNQYRTIKQQTFCMLNANQIFSDDDQIRFDFYKLDPDFFRKIKMLCGAIVSLGIFDKDDNLIYKINKDDGRMSPRVARNKTIRNLNSTSFNGWNLTRLKIDYFSLNISGFPASVSLLRMLLGHAGFFNNAYKLFEILETDKHEEIDD